MAEGEELIEVMQELASDFDQMCDDRWAMGAQQYGQFAFLGNDMIQFMIEELADTVNYCRAQAIKLRLLQQALVESEAFKSLDVDGDGNTIMKTTSFKPTREWGNG